MEKINLSPSEPMLDGSNLPQLARLWIDDCRLRLDPYTVDGYQYKIDHFLRWWDSYSSLSRNLLRKSDLQKFAQYLRSTRLERTGKPPSYNQQKNVLRRVRQMLKWAAAGNYTQINYAAWVPEPVGGVEPRVAASAEQLRLLLRAACQTSKPARNKTILAVFIGTGIRRAECASLDVQNIQLHADCSGTARVVGKKTKANATGVRWIGIDRTTGRYIQDWLDVTGSQFGPLFPGRQGKRLSPEGIYKVVKLCIEVAGLEGKIKACHALRDAFATHSARNSRGRADDDITRRQLGHESYSMTAHYSLFDAEDLRQRVRSPLSDG